MSSAKIDSSGKVTQLDGKGRPRQITEEYVQDPPKLSAAHPHPCRTDAVVSCLEPTAHRLRGRRIHGDERFAQSLSFSHKFGGRVRWWVVDQSSSGTVTLPLVLKDTAKTTADILYPECLLPNDLHVARRGSLADGRTGTATSALAVSARHRQGDSSGARRSDSGLSHAREHPAAAAWCL